MNSIERKRVNWLTPICLWAILAMPVAYADNEQQMGPESQSVIASLIQQAEKGDANAQVALGRRYFLGDGVPADVRKTILWYEKAALQGDSNGQLALAICYLSGQGISKDYQKAEMWFLKAARQGNSLAQLNIGGMYKEGIGVQRNYKLALDWLHKAASVDENHSKDTFGIFGAQLALAEMYTEGLGTPKDYPQAYRWLLAASASNPDLATEKISALVQRMTPGEIATGEEAFAKSKKK